MSNAETNAKPPTREEINALLHTHDQSAMELAIALFESQRAHAETRERLNEAQMKLEQTSRWSVANERDALQEQLAQAQKRLDVVADLIVRARVHVVCEELPGAHRTGWPLQFIDEALAALRAKQEPPPSPSRPAESPSSDTAGLQGRRP